MNVSRVAPIAAAALLTALPAGAAQYVYPLQGQGMARQASDEADCARLAAQQQGVDPASRGTYQPSGAPTGSAGDASATAPVLGAIPGNGLQGGAAGALGGGGPGQAGTATDALVHNAGGVAGRESPVGSASAARTSAPSGVEAARDACLKARGYSVH
jgi:hypothetical protein